MSISVQNINLNETKANLMADVRELSEEIGVRSYQDVDKLNRTAIYIEERFRSFGCDVKRQPFNYGKNTYYNIICEVKGIKEPEKVFIIGAHYDTVSGTHGADDNASGIAGLLEIARLTAKNPLPKTLRFIAFSIEEPPIFRTRHMGSYVYAKSLKDEMVDVAGMISLEMLGYFSEWEGSQLYPLPFFKWIYPKKGDFIALVGNISSRSLTKRFKKAFSSVSTFPVESLNTISLIPGVDFSDHSSFWKFGFPAFMITDTAFYRNPNYHSLGDTTETLNYDKMAELIIAIYKALSIML